MTLLVEFAGTDDLDEALRMWEAERDAMRDLRDENRALKIYNRRLRLIIDLSVRLIGLLERGGMFLPPKVPELIETIRKQIQISEFSIAQSKMLCE